MEVLPDFPDHRINDPLRQAELAVYRELQASEAEGTALYEVRPALNYTELDAVVWLIGVGRFALQVKGGGYRIERGVLYLLMQVEPTARNAKLDPSSSNAGMGRWRYTNGCKRGSRTDGALRSWSRW